MCSPRILRPRLVAAILALVGFGPVAAADLRISDICEVVIAKNAHSLERSMADLLRSTLGARYGARVAVRERSECRTSIFLGAEESVDAGLVKQAELIGLGSDGFLLRSAGPNIAIAGGGTAGTVYGGYEFLRRIGVRYYPWEFGDPVIDFKPLGGGALPRLDEKQRPFFDYRDVATHLDNGRNGTSFRTLTLGDHRFDDKNPEFEPAGWLAWDHTAGWLVPMSRHGGKRNLYREKQPWEPRPVPNMQVGVCQCHPDAAPIATDRTLEWIAKQPERRYFAITDADVTRPYCPKCEAVDPYPDYYTDRLLNWVNDVATRAGSKHPDKTFLTLAYLATVKPPRDVAPARNVTVMYAPWYWNSRTSSAVPIEHPLNLTAAEELEEWTRRFPGQVGVYDYPGDWVAGTAARIKDFAAKDVRWIYQNGPQGDMLRWVSTRLLWDPTRSTDALVREFCEAYYGPAANSMRLLYRALADVSLARGRYYRVVTEDERFARTSWRLIQQAEAAAARADVATRARIRVGLAEAYEKLLAALRSGTTDGIEVSTVAAAYVRLRAAGYADLGMAGASESALSAYVNSTRKALTGLGYEVDNTTQLEKMLAGALPVLSQANVRAVAIESPRRLEFSASGEAARWIVQSSSGPVASRVTARQGPFEDLSGVAFRAELTKLPTGKRSQVVTPFGRVSAERRIDAPFKVNARDSAYLRLAVSEDALATVYLNLEGQGLFKADVELAAGEQILRVDFGNFRKLANQAPLLTGIAIDFWPQSLAYPHPPSRDLEVQIVSLEVRADEPSPEWLPHPGVALWMSAFRANVPHGDGAIERAGSSPSAPATMLNLYGRATGENFRSFTSHRVLTPIAAIVAGGEDEALARQLQAQLKRRFGQDLPVLGVAEAEARGIGNQIRIGRTAIDAARLQAVDHGRMRSGDVRILARRGRVLLDGSDADWRKSAVERFIDSQGGVVARGAALPPGVNGLMTELFAVERTYFAGSLPRCGEVDGDAKAAKASIAGAEAAIRAAARDGRRGQLPPEALAAAGASAANCLAVRRLALDPFSD